MGNDNEGVSHAEIYHKLGSLEGLLTSLQATAHGVCSRVDRIDGRLVELERLNSTNTGGLRVAVWVLATLFLPLAGAAASYVLLRLDDAPPPINFSHTLPIRPPAGRH